MRVIPTLHFGGQGEEAIGLYKKAFLQHCLYNPLFPVMEHAIFAGNNLFFKIFEIIGQMITYNMASRQE